MSEKARKIKIIHDGSINAVNMRVVDAETGEMLRWVRRVELAADASGAVEAILYIHSPEIEIAVDAAHVEIRTEEMAMEERIAKAVVERIEKRLERLTHGAVPF